MLQLLLLSKWLHYSRDLQSLAIETETLEVFHHFRSFQEPKFEFHLNYLSKISKKMKFWVASSLFYILKISTNSIKLNKIIKYSFNLNCIDYYKI